MARHRKPRPLAHTIAIAGGITAAITGGTIAAINVNAEPATVHSDTQNMTESATDTVLEPEGVAERQNRQREAIPLEHYKALQDAQKHINALALSEDGLAHQLRTDGYSKAATNYALANVQVDYQDEAIKSAQLYLEAIDMSADRLERQLKFDGYSAEHAANAVKEAR